MPPFRSTDRHPQVTGGQNVSMYTDNRGTEVRFTGKVMLNGKYLSSPKQLRKEWADSGLTFLEDATATAGPDGNAPDGPPEKRLTHYRARANALVLATAVDLMDKLGTDDLPQLAEAFRVTAGQVRIQTKAAQARMDTIQYECVIKATDKLARLADYIETAATVTWIEQ